ncbi:TIGR02452 family protein [Pleurostoma richardsiae]|uniref:TIGR02452 family protein n=1 Tax=Pleurostoma richardsiae TaxID=41990 RepID=A0AA38RDB6_9PEZI|nr:TIGR02452 family protein [Pleurostoma richardsiae]
MGRTEPSIGRPPASFRRAARAKKAKATLNVLIPSLLSAHPRARRGIDAAELIVEPPAQQEAQNVRSAENGSPAGPRLALCVGDTLATAHSLLRNASTGEFDLSNKGTRVAVLNMASPLSPGGGFLNGAGSQEESLCMRTTLLPSLRDEYYRLPELGTVYTPDVLVFRNEGGEDLEKRDRWFVDCISSAMLRLPETETDEAGRGRYVHEKDRELVLRKMRVVLRVCQAKGARKIVLGTWGCGAYGNPVGEVGAAWRKVLLPAQEAKGKKRGDKERWIGIEDVVFAIKDRGMAEAFRRAFGNSLPVMKMADSDDVGEDSEEQEDMDEADSQELQDKIRELETRIQQGGNPHVRAGLTTVLTGLRSQLAEKCTKRRDRRDSEEEEEEKDDETDS